MASAVALARLLSKIQMENGWKLPRLSGESAIRVGVMILTFVELQ